MSKRGVPVAVIVTAAVAAGVGYLLLTTPGMVLQQYQQAQQLGPVAQYVYIGAVIAGLGLMVGGASYVAWRLFLAERRGKVKAVAEMSDAEKKERIAADISTARK